MNLRIIYLFQPYYLYIFYKHVMAGNNIDKTIYTGSSMSGSIEGRNNNSNPLGSYYRNNRVNLLTKEVAADFNTYTNASVAV